MFPDELRASLQLVTARAVLSDQPAASRMAAAVEALRGRGAVPRVAHVVVPQSPSLVGAGAGILSTEALFQMGRRQGAAADSYTPADIGDPRQHVAYILFSSGTTGKPKAVMTSDYSLLIHTLNPG